MNNIKDYWSELNPKELNDIINLFIKQKIFSPQKMRELYNQAINNSSSSRPQNISKYNKFDIGGLVDLDTTGSSKVLYSEDSENDNSNNNFIIKQALKIANEMLESNSISDNQKKFAKEHNLNQAQISHCLIHKVNNIENWKFEVIKNKD